MTDVDLNSDLLHKLASARRTVMQMCHDRGYQVNEEDMTMTLAQFKEQFGDRPIDGNPMPSTLNVVVHRPDDDAGAFTAFLHGMSVAPCRQ
eukprot:m.116006 g.116006  ORF g.116006 m.116006 type:complete len:91 (-) comp13585_c0_seq23:1199-1471(-)